MNLDKILWLEDQFETFSNLRSTLFRRGYLIDNVTNISEFLERVKEESYSAYVFDIKVLPGIDEEWLQLDLLKRGENPDVDTYLGFELLRSLFEPTNASIKLEQTVDIKPDQVIVFSVVDKVGELSDMGIPSDHIIYKAKNDSNTLPPLIEKIIQQSKQQD